jgi:DNA-binding NtrC family response regulator
MATSRSRSAYVACAPRVQEEAEAPKLDSLAAKLTCDDDGVEIVGSGAAMTRLRLQVRRIGPHFRTVLVSGEAGTGKRLAARALHRLSHGIGERFIVCDATTMSDWATGPDGVAASAGHLDRMVKMAQGGTLFFDRIGEMPMEAQVQLLRILRLQERSHPGPSESPKVNLRIIASTREDLKILTFSRRFRQELYQRLAMVEIALPPLRERTEDIPELAMGLMRRLPLLYGAGIERIAEDAIERLQAYQWPGNVRELDSVLRRAVVQCDGTVIRAEHLLEELDAEGSSVADAAGTARLQDVVEQHVLRVLKSCGGNKLRAAELLGISRSTLYRMLDSSVSSTSEVSPFEAGFKGRMQRGERYTG